jgi:beta-glucanase (GH16 family)
MPRVLASVLVLPCLLLAACSTHNAESTTNGAEETQMSETAVTQTQKPYELIWSDEFNGADGSLVDSEKWVVETGNNRGWGNNELQYYTDSPENCRIQDGNLVIVAIQEVKEGFQYTSARIKTMGKFEFQYGKVEMRAKLPQGMGIWPAFWMLGSDIEVNPWPQCGEIDIMEHIGRMPGVIHGTAHGPEYNGNMGIGNSVMSESSIYENLHTYAVEWDSDSIRWYFDDVQYHQIIREKLPTTYTWVFDKNFFLLVNLAVGGNWPQNPNDTTVFPQAYTIDYIRVYQ